MSKTILITGSSSGIGAKTAEILAEGNEIIVHYNSSEEKAKQVAKTVTDKGGIAYLVQADISKEIGCQKLVKFISEYIGKLSVLINNTGGLIKRQLVRDLEWDLLEKTFALNTFSAMKMCSLCIPLLEKSDQSCIINVTSIAIRHGAPTATIYGASKSALDSFTRGLAKELAPKIRVNAVAPGVIGTPFHKKHTSSEKMHEWEEATPLKRIGKSEEVAKVIKMLIENNFITGETIDINGGLSMR